MFAPLNNIRIGALGFPILQRKGCVMCSTTSKESIPQNGERNTILVVRETPMLLGLGFHARASVTGSPADTEGDGNDLSPSKAVGGVGADTRRGDPGVAGFTEKLHLAISIDTSNAMRKPETEIHA